MDLHPSRSFRRTRLGKPGNTVTFFAILGLVMLGAASPAFADEGADDVTGISAAASADSADPKDDSSASDGVDSGSLFVVDADAIGEDEDPVGPNDPGDGGGDADPEPPGGGGDPGDDPDLDPDGDGGPDDGPPPVIIDVTAPTVTINQAVGQAGITNSSPVLFDVVFSEVVTDFDANGVSTAGSTAGGTLAVSVSGSGSTYTVSVSGMTSEGTVVASIPEGAATDPAGNLSAASTSEDNTVIFDNVPPILAIEQAPDQADPTDNPSIDFVVTASEEAYGFTQSVLQAANGSVTNIASAGVLALRVTVQATAPGIVSLSVPAGAVVDHAGNLSPASVSIDNEVTYTPAPPPLTISVSGDITVDADPGATGAIVDYPAPTVTGGVSPGTPTCAPPSGSFFLIGTTTVTCTVEEVVEEPPVDLPSRLSALEPEVLAESTASASFTVTVLAPPPAGPGGGDGELPLPPSSPIDNSGGSSTPGSNGDVPAVPHFSGDVPSMPSAVSAEHEDLEVHLARTGFEAAAVLAFAILIAGVGALLVLSRRRHDVK